MRYGICTGLENIKRLKDMGYDYIEPSVTAVMKLEQEELLSYSRELGRSGLACEAFNILFPKTMALVGEDADRYAIQEHLKKAMERMEVLGGQVVVFGSGKCRMCPEGYGYARAYRELAEVCRMTGEIAAKHGITAVIEPLSRKETNMICTMAEGAILMEDVDHPNVKLLSDYFHVMANHDSLDDIKTIGAFSHIHIASEDGRRYPLYRDREAYGQFMGNLAAIGYDGRISIEGKTDQMEEDGPKALRLLKSLEARANG